MLNAGEVTGLKRVPYRIDDYGRMESKSRGISSAGLRVNVPSVEMLVFSVSWSDLLDMRAKH